MNLRVAGSRWISLCLASSAWAQTDVGSIRATLEPVEVVSLGPTWQAGGSGHKLSGDILDSLPPGNYTVSFSSVTGWTKPADQSVIVVGRRITEVTGRYTAQVALPVIDRHPAAVTVVVGRPWQISVQATGSGLIYTWYRDGVVVSQTTASSFGASAARDPDAGTYFVRVENSAGFVDSRTAIVMVTAPQLEPIFSVQPGNQNAVVGNSVSFQATAVGNPAPLLKWQRLIGGTTTWQDVPDGGQFSGSATTRLTVGPITAAMSGDKYRVIATNSVGIATSEVSLLTVTSATVNGTRLVNLSILTSLGSSDDSFTLGYVVGGTGTGGDKPLLIRAAGPSLSSFGVGNPLADPRLELYAGTTRGNENNNWGGTSALIASFTRLGAFAYLSAGSLDAALLTRSAGGNSVVIRGSGAGSVIGEIYDDTTDAEMTIATPRLINVSVLKNIGSGLTAGFVLRGSGSRTVLVRAVGPTLGAAPFNVGGVLADPQLTLFNGSTSIGSNDNWGGTSALVAAFGAVGAFGLPAGSRDAALLATLPPGSYTAQVTGVGGTSGVALVEVYEVP